MNARRARATLVTACTAHLLHEGLSDLLYVMFPVWARAFSLSFAQVGLLKTGYSGALALFQIPAGFLAERWGPTTSPVIWGRSCCRQVSPSSPPGQDGVWQAVGSPSSFWSGLGES